MHKLFALLLVFYATLVVSNPLEDVIVVEENITDEQRISIRNEGRNFNEEDPRESIFALGKFFDLIEEDLEKLELLTASGKDAIEEIKRKGKKNVPETLPNAALLLCAIECEGQESAFKPNKIFFSGKGTASGSKKIPALERMIKEAFSNYALRALLLQSNISILKGNQEYDIAPQAVMGVDHAANDEEVIESMRELFLGDKKDPAFPNAKSIPNAGKTTEFYTLFKRCVEASGHTIETVARDHVVFLTNPDFSYHYALGNQDKGAAKPLYNHDLYYHSEQALMKYLEMLEHTYWEDFPSLHEVFQIKTDHLFKADDDDIYKLPVLTEHQEAKLKQFFELFSLTPDTVKSIHTAKEKMDAFPEMTISLLVSSHKKMCPLCVMSFYKRFENQSIKRMFSILIMKALAYSLFELRDNIFIPDNFLKKNRWQQFNHYNTQLGNMQDLPLLSRISMKMVSTCNGN